MSESDFRGYVCSLYFCDMTEAFFLMMQQVARDTVMITAIRVATATIIFSHIPISGGVLHGGTEPVTMKSKQIQQSKSGCAQKQTVRGTYTESYRSRNSPGMLSKDTSLMSIGPEP